MTAGRVAAVAALVAAGLMLAIQVVAADLVTAAAPLGLVTLQVTPDPAAAAAVVAGWTGELRTTVLRAHALDLLLPCAYGTATVAAGRALAAGRAAGLPTADTARRAGRAGGAAAVLDQVENGAILATLLAGAAPLGTALTVTAAAGKWCLLAVSLLGLATVRWRTRGAAPQAMRSR